MANPLINQIKVGNNLYDLGNARSAESANKLSTPRSISVDTAVDSTPTNFDGSSNISIPVNGVKEAFLDWGGRNLYADFSPTDASMIPQLGANRLAFMPLAGVEYQYSRDNGVTWSEYETSDYSKINLFNGNESGFIIGAEQASKIFSPSCGLSILAVKPAEIS